MRGRMDKVTRIGVSLEPELLESFDEMIEKKGYATRSEAIRDLIRRALTEESWKHEGLYIVGTITLMYDHHVGNVQERLMEVQHSHRERITSTLHLHIDEERCLEVLLVNGEVKDVKALRDELISVKGVLTGKLTMISPTSVRQSHRKEDEYGLREGH